MQFVLTTKSLSYFFKMTHLEDLKIKKRGKNNGPVSSAKSNMYISMKNNFSKVQI